MPFERNHEHELERIILQDEEDNEQEAIVLASFEETKTKRTFVLYYLSEDGDIENEDVEVYASILDTDTNAFIEIESEEDWALVEEILQSLTVDEE